MSVCADEQVGLPAAVYRLYDSDGTLIYVGVARWPESRWQEHARSAVWWSEVAHREYEWVASRDEAITLEGRLIRAFRPRHNVVVPGRARRVRYDLMLPVSMIEELKRAAELASDEAVTLGMRRTVSAAGIVRAALRMVRDDPQLAICVRREAEAEWRAMNAVAKRTASTE